MDYLRLETVPTKDAAVATLLKIANSGTNAAATLIAPAATFAVFATMTFILVFSDFATKLKF